MWQRMKPLVDDDIVELSNLQRQILHDMAGLGRPKAESGRDALCALNPDVQVRALVERLEEEPDEPRPSLVDM